jgi:hypothetical protein
LKKLKIGIIDLAAKGPTRALYARVMHANLASIMPQAVAVWCEEAGHDVTLTCYTGLENLLDEVPEDADLVIIGAFSQAAQLSYALSNLFRSRGAITVLGGPHARCYPEDAQKYFDYVLGFTDRRLIQDLLQNATRQRPIGVCLAAHGQPAELPGVRQRWKFIEATLAKAPVLKVVPMIGSLGCPYTCSFCIDANVPYQPLGFPELKEDLKFLLTRMKSPNVGWHDPNFGVRFNDYLDAIEEADPGKRIKFIAESSLSLLSEPHLKRLRDAGFKALLPGIESWFDLGNKSKTGVATGEDKVRQVAEHVNLILRYIPYVQTNFVLGLDVDRGTEPFELTKRFTDLAPGAFPGYSLLSAFGRASALNLGYQRQNRVLPFPHHFLDNNQAMNVRPANYEWPEFYDNLIDLTEYSFSWPSIARRFRANREAIPSWMNVVRSISSEGFGRNRYHREIRRRLVRDPEFRPFFDGTSTRVPRFYLRRLERELGPLWQWLPAGGAQHDARAWLQEGEEPAGTAVRAGMLSR